MSTAQPPQSRANDAMSLTHTCFVLLGFEEAHSVMLLAQGTTLLKDVTATELAVEGALRVGSVALHGDTVRGDNDRGGSSSKNNESLEHD